MIVKGKVLSPGLAFGRLCYLEAAHHKITEKSELGQDVESKRFYQAVSRVDYQIQGLVQASQNKESRELLQSHALILKDPEFVDPILDNIKTGKTTEFSIREAVKSISDMLLSLNDDYLRSRVDDIVDIQNQLIDQLQGVSASLDVGSTQNKILYAEDIHPSQVLSQKYAGFVARHTSINSHSAILARSLGLPFLSQISALTAEVLLLDAEQGNLILHPTEKEISDFQIRAKDLKSKHEALIKIKDQPTELKCGTPFSLEINIGTVAEAHVAQQLCADGVGLFRSEFIFMEKSKAPSEDEQFLIYKNVLSLLGGRSVIIRTLDAGGDKNIAYLNIPKEENPYLGFRAIRIGLKDHSILKPQLRALLRAAEFGQLGIMIPMVVSVDEVLIVKEVLAECEFELKAAGIEVEKYRLGIMIETPAAVLMADELAKHVDFFSIGTNDLLQYLVAADRGNELVSDVYTNSQPALLRAIASVVQVAHRNNIEVGVCGDLASDAKWAETLLGFGVRHLSCSAMRFLKLKTDLREVTLIDCKKKSEAVLAQPTIRSVNKIFN
jgi:phosphoenolpyruvate-protein phosphotransferase (PTS system enzyme I)